MNDYEFQNCNIICAVFNNGCSDKHGLIHSIVMKFDGVFVLPLSSSSSSSQFLCIVRLIDLHQVPITLILFYC